MNTPAQRQAEPDLPLAAESTVHLPGDARDRLAAADGQLLTVDGVRVAGRRTWYEEQPGNGVAASG